MALDVKTAKVESWFLNPSHEFPLPPPLFSPQSQLISFCISPNGLPCLWSFQSTLPSATNIPFWNVMIAYAGTIAMTPTPPEVQSKQHQVQDIFKASPKLYVNTACIFGDLIFGTTFLTTWNSMRFIITYYNYTVLSVGEQWWNRDLYARKCCKATRQGLSHR